MAEDHITFRELRIILDTHYEKIEKKIDESIAGYGSRLKGVEDKVLIIETTQKAKNTFTLQLASVISFFITLVGFFLSYFTLKGK